MRLINSSLFASFTYKNIEWEAHRFSQHIPVDKFIDNLVCWIERNEALGLTEIEVCYERRGDIYKPSCLRFSCPLYTRQEHEIFVDYYQKMHERLGVVLSPDSYFVVEANAKKPRWAVIRESNADRFYDEIIRHGV